MRRKHFLADVLAFLARLFCGATVRVLDANALQTGQRIYVANHSSHLDFIILWSALPTKLRRVTRPVAAKDYWNKTALRRFLAVEIFRAILIEREKISAHNNPIETIRTEIGSEYSAILFPEGTRGSGGKIGTFKSGIFHLVSENSGLVCVPVYIENLNRVLPKGEILPLPLLCSVSLGAPIQLQPDEKKTAFLERLLAAVIALKEEML